jgi:hypothetical protein
VSQILGSFLSFGLVPNLKSGPASASVFFLQIKKLSSKTRTMLFKFSFNRTLLKKARLFKCAFTHNLQAVLIQRHKFQFTTATMKRIDRKER